MEIKFVINIISIFRMAVYGISLTYMEQGIDGKSEQCRVLLNYVDMVQVRLSATKIIDCSILFECDVFKSKIMPMPSKNSISINDRYKLSFTNTERRDRIMHKVIIIQKAKQNYFKIIDFIPDKLIDIKKTLNKVYRFRYMVDEVYPLMTGSSWKKLLTDNASCKAEFFNKIMEKNVQFLNRRIKDISNSLTKPDTQRNIVLFLKFLNDYVATLKAEIRNQYYKDITADFQILKGIECAVSKSDELMQSACIHILKNIIEFAPFMIYNYFAENDTVSLNADDCKNWKSFIVQFFLKIPYLMDIVIDRMLWNKELATSVNVILEKILDPNNKNASKNQFITIFSENNIAQLTGIVTI